MSALRFDHRKIHMNIEAAQARLDAWKACGKDKTVAISHVCQTQFSVVRHFGGCNYNGAHWHYDAESDCLFRADFWKYCQSVDKLERDAEADKQRERAKWESARQMELI